MFCFLLVETAIGKHMLSSDHPSLGSASASVGSGGITSSLAAAGVVAKTKHLPLMGDIPPFFILSYG